MNGIDADERSPSAIDDEERVFSYSSSNLETRRTSEDGEAESFLYTGQDATISAVESAQRESTEEDSYAARIWGSSPSSPAKASRDSTDYAGVPATASPKITANDEVSTILGCNNLQH